MSATPQRSPVILIVEDEPLVRLEAVEAFRERHWHVVEAHSVEAAKSALEAHAVLHVVFTDIDLNGNETGWDVADACRKRHRDVVVVYASGVQREHTRRVEDSLFFEKPYDCAAVIDATRAQVAKKKN
jgi:CheY-like chemotaxis protein